MKFEWEEINSNRENNDPMFIVTYRAKVIGGYIIRHEVMHDIDDKNCEMDGWQNISSSMVFIPDPEHKWEIEND